MTLDFFYSTYKITLLLVFMQNLVMGVTLMVSCRAKEHGFLYSKSGLIYLAFAMLAMSAINILEYIIGVDVNVIENSLAISVFAASIELFLLLLAYVSMLDSSFVTRKRVLNELLLIAFFTLPLLFIPTLNKSLFNIFLTISIAFYIIKLSANVIVYRKHLNRVTSLIENFHSRESSEMLAWINRTFYVILAIGVVSIFAPLGNFTGLALYNLFLLIAFFYIYIQVICNMYIFDGSMRAMADHQDKETATAICGNSNEEVPESLPAENTHEGYSEFMTASRRKIYQEWIDHKVYTDPGITAEDIAMHFNTNRTRLSAYLNNELGMNYYEWIARLRVEEAKRFLKEEPGTPICEIAVRVGIGDKSNFGRAFKRFTGMSPAEYRKEHLVPYEK